jgi:hypothetical protein
VLLELGTRWSVQWQPAARERTGVYAYRPAVPSAADQSVA